MKKLKFSLISMIFILSLSSCYPERKVTILNDLNYGNYSQKNGKNELLLDLYLPDIKSSESLPLLIYIHGGGWLEGDKKNCPGEIVAKRGYAVACINYRFSSEALFPAQIHDVKKAVRWLRKNANQYNLNPDKFGVWGASAGGHLSALLGTSAGVKSLEEIGEDINISSRIQAVCDWYAPTDFTQVYPAFTEPITSAVLEKNKHKPWFIYTVATHKLLGGSVSQKRELAALANPINYIDSSDPPFLIVHGELDEIVPISQSELLFKALKNQGVAVEFVHISTLKHSSRGKSGELFDPQLIDITLTFFDRYLKKGSGFLGFRG